MIHLPIEVSSASADRIKRHLRQEKLTAYLDVGLAILALVFLLLLIAELALSLPEPWSGYVVLGEIVIWAVFVVAFVVELALAPSRLGYLKRNWLVALSLALPALRVLRVARALRLLRTTRVVRGLGLARVGTALNRGSSALRDLASSSKFVYVAALTVLVTVTGAAAAYYFDTGTQESQFDSFPESLWWAATLVTTVNSQLEAESTEGRIIGLALRVFGVGVIGFLTARVAVYFLGRETVAPGRVELSRLHEKIDRLQATLEGGSRSGSDNDGQGHV